MFTDERDRIVGYYIVYYDRTVVIDGSLNAKISQAPTNKAKLN